MEKRQYRAIRIEQRRFRVSRIPLSLPLRPPLQWRWAGGEAATQLRGPSVAEYERRPCRRE